MVILSSSMVARSFVRDFSFERCTDQLSFPTCTPGREKHWQVSTGWYPCHVEELKQEILMKLQN
jgi:hypothetical protein